jgi:RimJ/RimL family protein N-acetyltransferase
VGRACEDLSPIETERLVLEPVTPKHASGLHDAVVDSRAELLPWMPWAVNPTLEASRAQAAHSKAAWEAGTNFHFAVIDRQSRAVLGVAGFSNEHPDAPELHYWIRTDHAGRGLATKAARALITWAATNLRADRIWLWAGRENVASRRVAEKLGFRHVGALAWRPDGGLGKFDAERYELTLSR